MHLNTLKPNPKAKKVKMRVGRGIGCGKGKTCGRGHKGQTARSGYSRKNGFEGGQLPLQRRLPKFGFKSFTADNAAAVRLKDLCGISADQITIAELKKEKLISSKIKRVKIILAGTIDKAITLSGIAVTAGARKAIEAAGGRIE